jgi:Fis family transcriptional regulator
MTDVTEEKPLRYWVEYNVDRYFDCLEGSDTQNIYKMVLKEVHTGLLRSVMRATQGNQSKAASVLGVARGTLRKLLEEHPLELEETE